MIHIAKKASWTAVATLLLVGSSAAVAQEHAMQSQQTKEKEKEPAPKPAKKKSPQAKGQPERVNAPSGARAGSKQEPAKPAQPEQQMDMQNMEHQEDAQHGAQKPPEAQQPGQQESHMQHMGHILVVKPEFPRMGKSQENPPTPLIRLDELEQM